MSRKKQGQRDKVLEMLRAGPATSEHFLDERVPRFSARIKELRDAGYVILGVKRPASSTWVYTLISEPTL